MKKTLIILIGIFFLSCSSDTTTHDINAGDTDTRDTETMDEIGSEDGVTPQLDMEGDTAALEVDTVTAPRQENQ